MEINTQKLGCKIGAMVKNKQTKNTGMSCAVESARVRRAVNLKRK